MTNLIDADAIDTMYVPIAPVIDGDDVHYEWVAFVEDINEQPTVDAIPISFIEEQVKLCNEIGFRRGEECYMALIEKWREKNGTETD